MQSTRQKKMNAEAQQQIQLKKNVQILWSKLNNTISQPLALSTQETNEAFYYKEKNIKQLKDFATGSSLSSYSLYFIVAIAAVVDVFLWQSTFKSVEGVGGTIANAVGLTVAIFGAMGAAIIGRAVKQKSTHESFHAENELGISKYDQFTPFQKTVFEKNTAHNYIKWGLAPVLISCILIPFSRWVGYGINSQNPVDGKLQATIILTGISYFVFVAVILFEMFMYCSWNQHIQSSISDYKTKNNLHKKLSDKAMKIGARLTNLSLDEAEKYNKFISQEKFRLHIKTNEEEGPKYGGPKKQEDLDEEEEDPDQGMETI